MKKSQRLRLAELKSKDASKLSGEEKAELARLDALAVANPDASKDEDDTKPLSVADFLSRLTSAFKDKAELVAKNTLLGALLAVVATFLGKKDSEILAMKPEELTAALNGKAGSGSQADANEKAVKAANDAKAVAEGNLTKATTQLGALATFLGVAPTALAEKPDDLATAINTRLELRTSERLVELGFPISGIPQNRKPVQGAPADLLHAYGEMTDATEAAEFYKKNIAPLLGQKTETN